VGGQDRLAVGLRQARHHRWRYRGEAVAQTLAQPPVGQRVERLLVPRIDRLVILRIRPVVRLGQVRGDGARLEQGLEQLPQGAQEIGILKPREQGAQGIGLLGPSARPKIGRAVQELQGIASQTPLGGGHGGEILPPEGAMIEHDQISSVQGCRRRLS
jgi:hypothetical protein